MHDGGESVIHLSGMIEDRYAVLGGVPKGTRGSLHGFYRSSGQVLRPGLAYLVPATTPPGRHVRGNWEGEHCLRHDAVPCVQRHPATIPLLGNERKISEKTRSCPTQGVGTTAQDLAQKAGSKCFGEAMAVHSGGANHRMACQASVVR